jgi:hypothetical protein
MVYCGYMGKASRRFHEKFVYPDGAIIEGVIWELPAPTAERPHGLKYRLYYGHNGKRLVGYDNEHGKGDHRHWQGEELPYAFVSVEQLWNDFMADVRRLRGET